MIQQEKYSYHSGSTAALQPTPNIGDLNLAVDDENIYDDFQSHFVDYQKPPPLVNTYTHPEDFNIDALTFNDLKTSQTYSTSPDQSSFSGSVASDLLPELSSSTCNVDYNILQLQKQGEAQQVMDDHGIQAFEMAAPSQIGSKSPVIMTDIEACSRGSQLKTMSQTPSGFYDKQLLPNCSEVPPLSVSASRASRQEQFDTRMSLDLDSELNEISISGNTLTHGIHSSSHQNIETTNCVHVPTSRGKHTNGPTSIPASSSASPPSSSSSSSSSTSAPTKRGRKRKVKVKRDRSVKNMTPERLERVRMQGRLAARRSRARKKAEIVELEKEGARLLKENSKLMSEKDQLKANIILLQQAIFEQRPADHEFPSSPH